MQTLEQYLTEGPQLFPEDMTTDQPERQVMAEIIREKMLRMLQKEIPSWDRSGNQQVFRSGTTRSST